MKAGKSLVEMAQELTRIRDTAKDYIVPTERMEMTTTAPSEDGATATPVLTFQNGEKKILPLTGWAHQQLAGYTDIPKAYYDRLRAERPELLAKNVNHGMERIRQEAAAKRKPEARMLRTVDGKVRALLSDRYRRLDSYDLLETVLPVMMDAGFKVESSEITERRLYIKAVTDRVQAEVKPGDVVQSGLIVSTSDVGAGSLRVEPLLYRLVCRNGMISNTAIRKFHVGRSQASDDISELLSSKTQELTDAAFWAQVRDVVLANLKPEVFEKQVDRIREAAGEAITNFDIPEVVELAMDRVGVNGEKVKNSMIAYLANGADGAGLNRWGLVNAMTYAAQQDFVSYDDSVDMERAASQILELPRKDWARIALAAA